jgi:hypothetical protein
LENPEAEARFRESINGFPEVPEGQGAWLGTSKTHPIWNQTAEVWAACASLCNLTARVERLLRELETVAEKACAKQNFTAFLPRMPDDHAQKHHCGIELLWNILRFTVSGYAGGQEKRRGHQAPIAHGRNN